MSNKGKLALAGASLLLGGAVGFGAGIEYNKDPRFEMLRSGEKLGLVDKMGPDTTWFSKVDDEPMVVSIPYHLDAIKTLTSEKATQSYQSLLGQEE